jgi:copper(I)-binding protein
MIMKRALLSLAIAASLLSACGPSGPAGPEISIENAWARPAVVASMSATPEVQDMSGMSVGGPTSAAYFVIVNQGSEADALIGVSSSVASKTEMHETRIENDVAEMMPVPRVDVPARARIEFKPGGYHVMLEGLTQDLKVGETIQLMLQFEKSGTITLDVPVQPGT